MYGGSHGTITPSFEYGGTFGGNCPRAQRPRRPMSRRRRPTADCFPGVQYYFTGRYLQTTVGLENATPAYNAIHDFSQQERGFAYMSAFVDPTTRVSLIAGTSNNNFQIPNIPGQPIGKIGNPPVTNAFGITNFNSALLNENQWRGHSLWRAVGADIRRRLRRAIVLFHPLQQSALLCRIRSAISC